MKRLTRPEPLADGLVVLGERKGVAAPPGVVQVEVSRGGGDQAEHEREREMHRRSVGAGTVGCGRCWQRLNLWEGSGAGCPHGCRRRRQIIIDLRPMTWANSKEEKTCSNAISLSCRPRRANSARWRLLALQGGLDGSLGSGPFPGLDNRRPFGLPQARALRSE